MPNSLHTTPVAEIPAQLQRPTFREAFRFWLKLGFISFGGPAGQIAIMHTELVERRRWISEPRFLHALNYCMLLPGPEAQQLATYIGWLLHKTRGGIVAGTLFVLPSAVILWALSLVYVLYGNLPWIAAIFYGLKPAVTAIVASAVIRIGQKALRNEVMWCLAAVAFVAIYFFGVPFPFIVLSAGILGFLGGHIWPERFVVIGGHAKSAAANASAASAAKDAPPQEVADHFAESTRSELSAARVGKLLVVWLGLWWLPVIVIGAWHGWRGSLFAEGVFFSKAAVVTFGGAYAVLPYVQQQAVEEHGWLLPGQMADGLALAETTPGPLIMVLQFVGFLGGWNNPGHLPPLAAATLGAAITTWATFVPCFLWIFLGAPHIERLRGHRQLSAALSTITAAVVGVVLNLAVWFALHVFRTPAGIDWFAIGVSAVVFAGMLRWKWGVVPVVIGGGLAGLGWNWLTGLALGG